MFRSTLPALAAEPEQLALTLPAPDAFAAPQAKTAQPKTAPATLMLDGSRADEPATDQPTGRSVIIIDLV